jgi:3-oxoacyl-[acyl-carrier-protein] synthase-3
MGGYSDAVVWPKRGCDSVMNLKDKSGNKSVRIMGTGSYLPERVVTNFDLEKILDTTDEWIYTKVGIKERRIIDDKDTTSDLAARAAKEALEDADVDALDIDLIIVATASPDMIQPSTACVVQRKIGAWNAAAFDVSAVCTGFVYALSIGADLLTSNSYKRALIIGAEAYSRILDWSDRSSCVFFGDGAGAAVISADCSSRGMGDCPHEGILGSYLMADGRGYEIITMPAGGAQLPASYETVKNNQHAFRMDGKKIWDFVVDIFPKAVAKTIEKCGLTIDNVDFVISHQANINLIREGMKSIGLPMSKTHTTIDKYGNTSGASVSITLDDAVRLGKIKNGDTVVLVAFGGGLTWGGVALNWNK